MFCVCSCPPFISARLSKAKKKGGKGQKDGVAPEHTAATPQPQIIQIHDQPEVVALPPKPVQRRLAGVLKRTGPQPEGERPTKRVRLPKSLEVVGIDLDPIQGISPMVKESSTEVLMATPIGTITSQAGRSEASSSRGKPINSISIKLPNPCFHY